jgi:uncharacterized small protein (DUF1192 family)
MDRDDMRPKPKPAMTVGEPLAQLAIAELEARNVALHQEIERVETELKTKRAHESAAAALFKS